ncbi:S-adenosylmethionine decarboxylase related protein [Cellulomonas flavigena DSM 20109]|uniref:S-adenosylmethionine decarboxylase related protein n=1 Tax=Cellulomonas flavigena (strain ATCC 482 / DSM 20109 / BCRC 11376 / JCM 18109 / NBRC 3775 / NCIMB 8073 / NRS 134) TaxID=446466 RepID=D5UDB6_CELFN|nr:S-adenosylmethionine decarboxylase [Cellulomonas flavigena]ADG76372.1 S-adenosylmethionine decarboxylase related protein [Cellulomonas flavigena DSM 20109]
MHRNHVYVFDVATADPAALDDLDAVRGALTALADDAGLHPVGAEAVHRFAPQGLSLAVLLAESHVAVHTWPELGTAYVTLTTCRRPGSGFVERTRTALARAWGGEVVARTVADA